MRKVVNGQEVEVSADEAEAIQAEWDSWRPGPRRVSKSLIVQRLIDAGLIEAAHDALEADKSAKARWYAPDSPAIYHDDPEAIAMLKAIGADPEAILAP